MLKYGRNPEEEARNRGFHELADMIERFEHNLVSDFYWENVF